MAIDYLREKMLEGQPPKPEPPKFVSIREDQMYEGEPWWHGWPLIAAFMATFALGLLTGLLQ
jgi:hypothetical protein